MAFTNSTTHYGLPQWIGTDKPTYLVDQNNAYATIDTQLYTASTDASSAVATANSAASSATTAAENAATALSTANTADGKADSAITQSELAQTAAGAAQVAAAAAQEAAAGNSITNLAPAYDSTLTYNVGDLVTAEGKLYKCIVTVSTPMDFDINYWDDVTTSEIYARKTSVTVISNAIDVTSSAIPFTNITSNDVIENDNAMNIVFSATYDAAVSSGDITIGKIPHTITQQQFGYCVLYYNSTVITDVCIIAADGTVKIHVINNTENLHRVLIAITILK